MTPVSWCLYSFLQIPDTDGVLEYITDHPGYAARSAFVIFEGPILACVLLSRERVFGPKFGNLAQNLGIWPKIWEFGPKFGNLGNLDQKVTCNVWIEFFFLSKILQLKMGCHSKCPGYIGYQIAISPTTHSAKYLQRPHERGSHICPLCRTNLEGHPDMR